MTFYRVRRKNFSLIELVISTFLIAILAQVGSTLVYIEQTRGKETALKKALREMRDGIDNYHLARGKFPARIRDLVDNRNCATEGFYLRRFPANPFVGTFAWEVRASTPTDVWFYATPASVAANAPPVPGGIFDVRFPKKNIIWGIPVASASIKSVLANGNYYWQW